MGRHQLELAWLGSIFTEPELCRRYGLLGLDQSMFEDKAKFDLGIEFLRDSTFQARNPKESMLIQMMEEGFCSKIEKAFDEGYFSAAYFKYYASEIEKRSDRSLDPQWTS